MKQNIDRFTVLPDSYFKDRANRAEFIRSLKRNFPISSRELPDELTVSMSELMATEIRPEMHWEHWHQMCPQDDERSLRNLLKVDLQGRPVYQSQMYDVMRYADTILQNEDLDYRQHVVSWCLGRIYCADDQDES